MDSNIPSERKILGDQLQNADAHIEQVSGTIEQIYIYMPTKD